MKVLVIGSGGREHALCWKIKQSSKVRELYCAPGNGGIASVAQCVDIKAEDVAGLLKFAKDNTIDLTVVGPEVPLVAGIVDKFEKAGLKIFGPSKEAAQLEGSKSFAKEFMHRHRIPTAEFQIFTDYKKAAHVLKQAPLAQYPIVIKADGLAAGKGVVIAKDFAEIDATLKNIFEKKIFKDAGKSIVVEDCLKGEEVSILAICDGKNFVLLDSSQDHKRIFDNDKGPNTGGMGAYSPVPSVSKEMMQKIADLVIAPTLEGMAEEGIPFKGILYAGLMLTLDGPFVLEYNVRFGDPEAQVIIPRLKDDLVDLMLLAINEKLAGKKLKWQAGSAACVVVASGGYPGEYKVGKEIKGLSKIARNNGSIVFHAGTKKADGKILTSGGRVLGVTGFGKNLKEAITEAYHAVKKISFEKHFYRKDIGARALNKKGAQEHMAQRHK